MSERTRIGQEMSIKTSQYYLVDEGSAVVQDRRSRPDKRLLENFIVLEVFLCVSVTFCYIFM